MDALAESERLIKEIGEGIDYKDVARTAVHNFAEDANSSSHHFVLELLQNADDNTYKTTDKPPVLTLTYDSHLRLHCNEDGFSLDDVKAICNFGKSTKKGSDGTAGEKGIGFKSVFRVADALWIASKGTRPFKFRLEKENPLVPHFFSTPFPDGSSSDDSGTSMYLEIASRRAGDVRRVIHEFEPTNIVFLKKLVHIDTILQHGQHHKRRLSRRENPIPDGSRHITIIERVGSGDEKPILHYVAMVFRTDLGVARTLRGQDITTSEITLAFPSSSTFHRLEPKEEKAYARLPIGHFGFKFAIDANFVLASNRQDIHEDDEWNQKLRDAIPHKLVEAITALNKLDSALRYTWPPLLELPSNKIPFFGSAMEKTTQLLKNSALLETETGEFKSPGEILFVPDHYRLGKDHRPPFPTIEERSQYLSRKYDPEACRKFFDAMGVKTASNMTIWRHLLNLESSFGSDKGKVFDAEWHGEFAAMILESPDLRRFLLDLPLCPVRPKGGASGRDWVKPKYCRLFFSTNKLDNDDADPLPSGINARYIPWEDHQDPRRKKLFVEEFKANDLSTSAVIIADLIREAHAASYPPALNAQELISHVMFLYRHCRNSAPMEQLWVFTRSGECHRVYETFAEPLEYDGLRLDVPILHEGYAEALHLWERRFAFFMWMKNTFKMPRGPRLATSANGKMSLSPEIKMVAEKCDTDVFLKLLRKNWRDYEPWLTKGSEKFQEGVLADICEITIHCQDSEDHPLSATMLPSHDLEVAASVIPLPLLPIPVQCDRRAEWHFLEVFGVKISLELSDWADCLKRMRSLKAYVLPARLSMVELAWRVYSRLDMLARGNRDLEISVKGSFQVDNLIYVPASATPPELNQDIWVTSKQCMLHMPSNLTMRHSFALTPVYQTQYFFGDTLMINQGVTFKRLLNELNEFKATDPDGSAETVNYIGQLLGAISLHVKTYKLSFKDHEFLRKCPLFPIRRLNSTKCFDMLCSMAGNKEWFIADHQSFLEGFVPPLPLTVLSVEQIREMAALLRWLHREETSDRRLSRVARISADGLTEKMEYADMWMSRAEYIDRLVTDEDRGRVPALSRMRIRAFTATTVQWKVVGRKSYYGTVSQTAVADPKSRTELHMYLKDGDMTSSRTMMELANSVCDMLRISADRRLLVSYIMSEKNPWNIEATLKNLRIGPVTNRQHFSDSARETEEVRFLPAERRRSLLKDEISRANTSEEPKQKKPVVGGNGPSAEHGSSDVGGEKPEKKTRETPEDGPGNAAEQPPNELDGGERGERLHPGPGEDGAPLDTDKPDKVRELRVPGQVAQEGNATQVRDLPIRTAGPNRINPGKASMADVPEPREPPPSRAPPESQSSTMVAKRDPKDSRETAEKRPRADEEEQDRMALKEVIPLQSLRSRAVLSRLSPARRLQESSVAELLLQSPLPIKKMAERISSQPKQPTSPSLPPEKPADASTTEASEAVKKAESRPASPIPEPPKRRGTELIHERAEALDAERRARRARGIVRQFSGSVEASLLFRPSTQTSVYFVTRPEELEPPRGDDGSELVTAVLESRLHIPKDNSVERSVYALVPMASEAANRDADFLGQVWVSQLLANQIGSAYDPAKHWTSPLCAKLYPDVKPTVGKAGVPFEFQDDTARAAFTRLLLAKAQQTSSDLAAMARSWLQRPPVYYIDVATTAEDRSIIVDSNRFHKARKYHARSGDEYPEHVFIFVRIFNVNSTDQEVRPKAAFYIDLWQMYTDGQVKVTPFNNKRFEIKFTGAAHFTLHQVEAAIYKWTQLPGLSSIRLLRLEKGDAGDRLEGVFEYCDLESKPIPEYMAVSYAWGSALKQFSIHICGTEKESPILLPASLYLALRRLRRRDESVLLWADAICIDQTSKPEKVQQIMLLSRIFQSAGQVFAWIGDCEDGSDDAIELLQNMGTTVLNSRLQTQEPDGLTTSAVKLPDAYLPQFGDSRWAALGNLLGRTWFSRVWIVQEAVLAGDLVVGCGDKKIPWDVLHAAASFCFLKGLSDPKLPAIADEETQKNILHLGNLRAQAWTTGDFASPDDLFTLLQLFHQKDVTNPRDRLFALASMATDGANPAFRPDYDVDEDAVIVRYAACFAEHGGHGPDLLYQARMAADRGGGNFPSWVPKLTEASYPRTVAEWDQEFRASGPEAGMRLTAAAKVTDGRILHLQGYRIDTILRLGDQTSSVDDAMKYLDDLFESVDATFNHEQWELREQARFCLAVGGRGRAMRDDLWDSRKRQAAEPYAAVLEYMTTSGGPWKSSVPETYRETFEGGEASDALADFLRRSATPYLEAVVEFAAVFGPADAAACETRERRVGVVPSTAAVGDEVVVFRGARVPYLVRKVRPSGHDESSYYIAVGECYVEGVMYGELFGAAAQSELPLRTFKLR